MKTCDAIVEAIATSSHYPCVAAQLCADDGAAEAEGLLGGQSLSDIQCAWDKKAGKCAPHGLCRKSGSPSGSNTNVSL